MNPTPNKITECDDEKQLCDQELDFAYWLTGKADSGINYCFDCAEKELKRINDEDTFIDGGFPTGHDYMPQCEDCCTELGGYLNEGNGDVFATFAEWRDADK